MAAFVIIFLVIQTASAFEIDWSRREKYLNHNKPVDGTFSDPTIIAPEKTVEPQNIQPMAQTTEQVTLDYGPAQDVVVLNTDKGFVPKSLSLRAGVKYRLTVVNVNEKEKNVSFIMSAFSKYEGTYFGQMKTFEIIPSKEGVYTYECPETSQEGRVVVVPNSSMRLPASEK